MVEGLKPRAKRGHDLLPMLGRGKRWAAQRYLGVSGLDGLIDPPEAIGRRIEVDIRAAVRLTSDAIGLLVRSLTGCGVFLTIAVRYLMFSSRGGFSDLA
jgi:hypothetical protein